MVRRRVACRQEHSFTLPGVGKEIRADLETYLAPIERPSGPLMKFVYFVSRKMFGKVVTPLKVVYARLPLSFTWFSFKIGKLDKQLELPAETRMLIRERVARINVCLFCIDIGRSFTI